MVDSLLRMARSVGLIVRAPRPLARGDAGGAGAVAGSVGLLPWLLKLLMYGEVGEMCLLRADTGVCSPEAWNDLNELARSYSEEGKDTRLAEGGCPVPGRRELAGITLGRSSKLCISELGLRAPFGELATLLAILAARPGRLCCDIDLVISRGTGPIDIRISRVDEVGLDAGGAKLLRRLV